MIESMKHLLLGLVITCTTSLSASATVVESLDLTQLVGRSDRIVRGHVASQRAYWADGRIWTDATIRVDQAFKGGPVAQLVVRRLGGKVGGIGMRTIGEVEFADGEEVFLFVRRAADVYQTVGLSQGKFRILRDATGAHAVTNLGGAKLYGPDQPAVRELGDLEKSVKALVGGRQ